MAEFEMVLHSTVCKLLILKTSLRFDVVQNLLQVFVFKSTLETWNESLRFFARLRTEVGERCQFKFVQFLLDQQTAHGTDGFSVLVLGEALRVVESLDEDGRQFLLVLRTLVLVFPVLKKHLNLRYQ